MAFQTAYDSISPNRHRNIGSITELGTFVRRVRSVTGKPVGVKIVAGHPKFLEGWFADVVAYPEHCPHRFCRPRGPAPAWPASPTTAPDPAPGISGAAASPTGSPRPALGA